MFLAEGKHAKVLRLREFVTLGEREFLCYWSRGRIWKRLEE